ncbi:hypothetical protein BMW23_0131 [Bodo saltans virus]|uniref:Glycosyltransferase n=1 Tax=Bodo saltans virus TaxID=2024608 RepID=A0A2H4UTC9_9VIRU|nr:hypothetical protein QJ851_gp0128 [Bodo saltans virus]ATZ80191.1 hypothetical protein BMW23_0131 [Bodo saltans virus]
MQEFDRIVVSLTTISSRLELLKKVIVNMFEQTIRPNIVHVFYSHEPLYYDDGIDNATISKLNKEIDMINFYNVQVIFTAVDNIGSYRKLIPALKIYKNDIIITIDDDNIFELTFIQKYMYQYLKNNCIVCSGGKFFNIKDYNNDIDHSSILNINYTEKSVITAMNYIPQGSSGILYHTKMFDSDFIDFDYEHLSEIIKKNDDVFFRNYTFRKNIKILFLTIKRTNLLDIDTEKSLYYDYNIDVKTSDILHEISKLNFHITNEINTILDINECKENVNENDEILYFQIQNNIKQSNRADIKLLQYEEHSHVKNLNTINLKELIENHLIKKETTTNCIIINIEKDIKRYLSAIDEIKKLSFNTFVHLKATFWKEKKNFVKDLNFVFDFLRKFNDNIPSTEFTINEFSELNDKNVKIQDGPLACYCSHVRAMIYGYMNFKDYTIICEDDIFIGNTDYIETNIKCIPADWDIICFNSKPINVVHSGAYYKFNDTFCSLHFYVIRNSCYERLFKYLYPVHDQIDIIIGNLHKTFNIYNIINTVYQKNFSTNTQNNLNVIMNTPGYAPTRNMLMKIHNILLRYINITIPNNLDNNEKLCSYIVSDVLYDYIMNNANYIVPNDPNNDDNDNVDDIDENENSYFLDLYEPMYLFVKYCVKGINTRKVTFSLMNDIKHILESFVLHNTVDDNMEIMKAYSYGSSSNVYLTNNKKIL